MLNQIRCINCGVHSGKITRGMCNNCYRYWKRNGCNRPAGNAHELRRRTRHTHCVNCGVLRTPFSKTRRSLGGRGMCNGCYQFLWENGRMREASDRIRSWKNDPGICRNCKQNTEFLRGLCQACYAYKQRYGNNRPRRLWREECSNCHVPLNGYKPIQGRCRRCQRYYQEFKKERPEHAWNAPLGWCDCSDGKEPVPATHIVVVPYMSSGEAKISLCDDCYAEELEMEREYGLKHMKKDT